MSEVRGSAKAIAALQANTVHAFQRPDDDVSFDPTRTSLRGDAQRISFSKFGGGITRFQTVYQRFSPGFETNDMGYQQRADEQQFRTSYSDRAARGGPAIRNSPSQSMWGGVESDNRKPITAGLWFFGGRSDGGRSFHGGLDPSLSFRLQPLLGITGRGVQP